VNDGFLKRTRDAACGHHWHSSKGEAGIEEKKCEHLLSKWSKAMSAGGRWPFRRLCTFISTSYQQIDQREAEVIASQSNWKHIFSYVSMLFDWSS
jgi:hypothetical protein